MINQTDKWSARFSTHFPKVNRQNGMVRTSDFFCQWIRGFGNIVPIPLFPLFYWRKWLRASARSAMSMATHNTINCKAQQHQRQETHFWMVNRDYEMEIFMRIAINEARRFKRTWQDENLKLIWSVGFSRWILQSERILTISRPDRIPISIIIRVLELLLCTNGI